MTEKLLHYPWRFQYFNRTQLLTDEGERLEIVSPGILNYNQGPDFTNARIKIGGTLFAGAVELHLKSSDWQKHGHQGDRNYDNVILHAVFKKDVPVSNGIPLLELEPHISAFLWRKYEWLMNATTFIPCSGSITQINELTWISWKERLLAERLTRKAAAILTSLKESRGHWEQVFWRLLARGFGAKVNADAFEAVAASIPLALLGRHKNQIRHLEALLLGQAGLLQKDFTEDYPKQLEREYQFLKKKYNLLPISVPVHFLRMRPLNFPTIRLAQLAMLIHRFTHLFSRILEADHCADVKQWLTVTPSDYWHTHFRLDHPSGFRKKTMGADMVDHLIINTVVPVLFAYGLYHEEEKYKSKALRWLEQLSSEDNTVVKGFADLSVVSKTAFDSQALLELKNEYCKDKRCLECSVGNYLLKA